MWCLTGSSNPPAQIVWEINGEQEESNISVQHLNGEFGGDKTRSEMAITAHGNMNRQVVSCIPYYKNKSLTEQRQDRTLNVLCEYQWI